MSPFLQHNMYMSPRSFMMDPFTAQASMQMAAFVRASADAARGIAVPPVHQWGHLNPNFDFGGGRLGNGAEIEDSKGDAGQAYEADDAGYSKPMPSPVLTPAVQVQVHKFCDAVSVPVQVVRPLLPIDGSSLGQIQPADPLAGVSTNLDPPPADVHHGSNLGDASDFLDKISKGLSAENKRTIYLPTPISKPAIITPTQNLPTQEGIAASTTPILIPTDSECQEIFMTGSHQRSVGLAVTRSKRKRVGGVKEEPPTKLPLKAALAGKPGSTGRDSGRDISRDRSRNVPEESTIGPRDTRRENSRSNKNIAYGEVKQESHRYNTNSLKDKRELGDVLGSEKARVLKKMGDEDWKDRVELEKKLVEDEKEDTRAACVEVRKMVESGGMDIEVRKGSGLRNVAVGVRLVPLRGSRRQESLKGRNRDIHAEGSMVQLGRGSFNGADGLDVSTPGAPGTETQADQRYAVHYTILLSSAL
ncbi:hypothetical protein DL95DRAFT_463265 [Leptodontidium sp. 2 PMI_412]|nr:hypothetical protein DL95DRAFT_463265 [Leptodontidium sp. 2 PMI_412]